MVSRREWYERANAAWPEQLPALTAGEAVRAARRLYRFVTRRTWKGEVVVTSGNRYSKVSVYRNQIIVNPDAGWHSLVHLLSHYLYRGGHTKEHARLERRMIKEVVRRGWLTGTLKDKPKPPAPPVDKRAQEQERLAARLARWETKQRRAIRAIAKLRRRLRILARRPVHNPK